VTLISVSVCLSVSLVCVCMCMYDVCTFVLYMLGVYCIFKNTCTVLIIIIINNKLKQQ